ncbi:hypothetical protein SAMN05661010_02550 [Modicisalibacter muralis]|uniref:Uncharacterized protein n=1 Tax=Modicisalibacter muralis TaxID=119000 RepID=A0A1G9MYE3_9GAMM|nr:hypothetical protein [Halomonas muralis]SDL78625.1 hypothetical protein SAMN05661010_02550 [Halomonas muralis]
MATNVTTVEEGLHAAGEQMQQQRMALLARNALGRSGELVIVTTIRAAKQGAVVAMEARHCEVTKFRTFIRLK